MPAYQLVVAHRQLTLGQLATDDGEHERSRALLLPRLNCERIVSKDYVDIGGCLWLVEDLLLHAELVQ